MRWSETESRRVMNYKNTNDYEVMYLIGENKEDALTTLFDKYQPIIMELAYQYYTGMNGKGLELDDFVQEGYIGLNRAIEKYDINKNCLFYTFAKLCIERQMQTAVRNCRTKKQEVLNHAVSLDYSVPNTDLVVSDIVENIIDVNPVDYVLDLEYQKALILFEHDLPFIQSQVFELRYNGFSYEEIGLLLDLSKKSIDSHLVRIRRKLKRSGLYRRFYHGV